MNRHILVGMGAAALLFLFYLGVLSIGEGFGYALREASKLWYWMALLAGGLGAQAGLFSFIRQKMKERRRVVTASMATSGGASASSMAACCAHYVSNVLPFLGLSGVAAFLADYRVFFIIVGIVSNMVGITIMLDVIQRHGLSQQIAKWKWNMRKTRKAAMISAPVVLALVFFANVFVA